MQRFSRRVFRGIHISLLPLAAASNHGAALRLVVFGLAACVVAGSAAGAGGAEPSGVPGRSSSDAVVEDSIVVKTKPLTLREIIARCIEGEKSKLAGRRSMTHSNSVRLLIQFKNRKQIRDSVFRVYENSDGHSRVVEIDERTRHFKLDDGNWVPHEPEQDEQEKRANVDVSTDSFSDFTELPFFLESQEEFDFELLDRIIEPNRVVLEVGFKPKSSFKPLPSGTVYIDTGAFRIIHEEFRFDKNPLPLFMKGISRFSRHWTQLPTGEWVFTKMMGEFSLRFGWLGKLPEKVSIAVLRHDFAFDEPYDEHVFGKW